jgi:catechol 2,3-dioxygenase-like lactoylglutathione lyase family enzyme
MITEVNHIGILVHDLNESLAFYRDGLGGHEVWRNRIEAISLDFVYVQFGTRTIELLHAPWLDPARPIGVDHIAFHSDDLDADYAAVVAAGYRSQDEPRTAGSGVGRTAFVFDPSGVRVELIQRDLQLPAVESGSGPVRSFEHVSLSVVDFDEPLRFYGDTLGMDVIEAIAPQGADADERYLGIGQDRIELRRPAGATGPGEVSHLTLRVDDLDAALLELGVQPDAIVHRIRQGGRERVATIVDPNGVVLELIDGNS